MRPARCRLTARHRRSGEKNDLAGVAHVAREFASIARNRSKPAFEREIGSPGSRRRDAKRSVHISASPEIAPARNRVLVLAGVVAIARELVDRIAQVAHIDRLRDSTSAGKKARLEKKRNRTRCCLHFSCRNCRARQGKSSPVRRVRVGAKILRLCQRQSLKQA